MLILLSFSLFGSTLSLSDLSQSLSSLRYSREERKCGTSYVAAVASLLSKSLTYVFSLAPRPMHAAELSLVSHYLCRLLELWFLRGRMEDCVCKSAVGILQPPPHSHASSDSLDHVKLSRE